MNLIIKQILYRTPEYEESLDIRNEVLRKPLGLDIRKYDDLTKDKEAEMYGGYLGDRLVSTIFLMKIDDDTVQIKSVAVLDEFRGKGYGYVLMDFIENRARELGFKKSFLNGRVTAEEFYHKLGYKTMTEPYIRSTIPHVDMEKDLY